MCAVKGRLLREQAPGSNPGACLVCLDAAFVCDLSSCLPLTPLQGQDKPPFIKREPRI